ncbi:hypothetical protein F4859DRAFT_85142 [Xylaria cf. heliscus]|nr:hypothetical protein F4859DRAFT_85142 [Xylaria cf. heliscus]
MVVVLLLLLLYGVVLRCCGVADSRGGQIRHTRGSLLGSWFLGAMQAPGSVHETPTGCTRRYKLNRSIRRVGRVLLFSSVLEQRDDGTGVDLHLDLHLDLHSHWCKCCK